MKIAEWLKSEMEYGRDLADSGWQGARASMPKDEPVRQILGRSVRASWVPALTGIGVGALCGLLVRRSKPKAAATVALGIIGGVVGFSAGVAWETRDLSSTIARGALRNMGVTRDSHWLGKHPISFG